MLMFCLQHWYNKSTLWELLILQAKKARPVVLNLGKISSYKGVNLLNHKLQQMLIFINHSKHCSLLILYL